MRRGQAFETMMLVISVIVALAILAVLMNILGGITIGVGDPKGAMNEQLSQIVSKGYGVTPAKRVTFEVGSIFMKEILKNTPIIAADVCIVCDSELCAHAAGKPIRSSATPACKPGAGGFADAPGGTVKTVKLDVQQKVEAQVASCGDTGAGLYCISIARNADKATANCETLCKLS